MWHGSSADAQHTHSLTLLVATVSPYGGRADGVRSAYSSTCARSRRTTCSTALAATQTMMCARVPCRSTQSTCGSTQSILWEYSERCGSLARSRLCWLPLRRYPVATQHIILQHSTPCCSTVQHVAAQDIMLQHSTLCCSTGSHSCCDTRTMLQRSAAQRSAPRCDAVDEHVALRRCILRCIHCGGTSAHCAVALPPEGRVPCGH